jgi:hypothetical protein
VGVLASLLLLMGTALALWLTAAGPGRTSARTLASQGSRKRLSSLPLTAQTAFSGAIGANERAYRVHVSGGGFRVSSPAQSLWARFDRSGVLVGSGAARLGLSARDVGYGDSLTALGDIAPRARANRVVYVHGGLSEWYLNGPAGLEQGFTFARAPSGGAVGPLTLSLALSGDLRATLAAGGGSVAFAGTGGPSLRYGGLSASDARGRGLHSWLELRGQRLLLRVDTRGARFPVRIDPLIQQGSKLTGSEETGEGRLGYSVALSSNGNTAVVGGYTDNSSTGAAWVFTRSGWTWSQQGSKLTGSGESGAGEFGYSVAISPNGNTVTIGGPADNSDAGAVWVFTRSGSTWSQQGSKLTGSGESGKGEFGSSVTLGSSEGNTALIGGPADNSSTGAVWVFTRSGSTWSQQGSKLTGSGESGAGKFGSSVVLSSEDTQALIGGQSDNTNVGAVWAFRYSTSCPSMMWVQEGSKLTGSGESGKGEFGSSVALSSNGSTGLVGGRDDNTGVGGAWVFTRSASTWTQQGSKLTGGSESGEGFFGTSVSLSSNGNAALIGGYNDKKAGAAWEFTRSESSWTQLGSKLTGAEESGEGHFGASVALSASGETGLVGGPADKTNTGAAWVFTYGFSSEEDYGLGEAAGYAPGSRSKRTTVQLTAAMAQAGPAPSAHRARSTAPPATTCRHRPICSSGVADRDCT